MSLQQRHGSTIRGCVCVTERKKVCVCVRVLSFHFCYMAGLMTTLYLTLQANSNTINVVSMTSWWGTADVEIKVTYA